MKAECVLDCGSMLGEGPLWSPDDRCLLWTDIAASKVHRWNPNSGELATWHTPERVTAMAFRESGGLIAAAASGVDLWDPETDTRVRLCAPEANVPGNRSNDGKCDRQGRFWFGTMPNDQRPDGSPCPIEGTTGNLYRVDPDGSVGRFETGIEVSNTFAWSHDNRIMYFGDSAVGIHRYDFDPESGAISNRRPFAPNPDSAFGRCDGSTIDDEGFLWNARWEGGCVIRWSPDGAIDRVVDIPCPHVTSAIFGGEDLDTLFVTTSGMWITGADRDDYPLAGGLFAIDTGTRGIAEVPFAG